MSGQNLLNKLIAEGQVRAAIRFTVAMKLTITRAELDCMVQVAGTKLSVADIEAGAIIGASSKVVGVAIVSLMDGDMWYHACQLAQHFKTDEITALLEVKLRDLLELDAHSICLKILRVLGRDFTQEESDTMARAAIRRRRVPFYQQSELSFNPSVEVREMCLMQWFEDWPTSKSTFNGTPMDAIEHIVERLGRKVSGEEVQRILHTLRERYPGWKFLRHINETLVRCCADSQGIDAIIESQMNTRGDFQAYTWADTLSASVEMRERLLSFAFKSKDIYRVFQMATVLQRQLTDEDLLPLLTDELIDWNASQVANEVIKFDCRGAMNRVLERACQITDMVAIARLLRHTEVSLNAEQRTIMVAQSVLQAVIANSDSKLKQAAPFWRAGVSPEVSEDFIAACTMFKLHEVLVSTL